MRSTNGEDCLFVFGTTAPIGPESPHSRGFYNTHNDTPQSVGLLWASDQLFSENLYLTTHNIHNRQTSMPPVGFEPTISAGERQQLFVLKRAATETGKWWSLSSWNVVDPPVNFFPLGPVLQLPPTVPSKPDPQVPLPVQFPKSFLSSPLCVTTSIHKYKHNY